MINNFNELAAEFNTIPSCLEAVLSNMAHMDLNIENFPTHVRISHSISGYNAELSIICKYPFNIRVVTMFLNSLEVAVDGILSIYDDPLDMLMNMSNPGEEWTLEDAGQILSEAEAQGWQFAPDVNAQFILDLYNDMEPEEEE